MQSIHTRATSAFPVSIGTSLALESLFKGSQVPYDPDRVIPEYIDHTKYDEMWFNVDTLIRNLLGATDKLAFMSTPEDVLAYEILNEIGVINSVFEVEGGNLCRPRYYTASYKTLEKKAPEQVKFRKESTEYQVLLRKRIDNIKKQLAKETEAVMEMDSEIKSSQRTKALILTHVPYDLFSIKNFNTLNLLESHTGVLKTSRQWNTKYYSIGDRDLSHLPFFKHLLLVLGDKSQFSPNSFKLRSLIYDISIQRNWTPLTTIAKVKFDYEMDIKEPYVLQFLNTLIKLGD